RVRVDGNLLSCSGELSAGRQRATVIVDGVGGEANVGMVGNVEELVRAEMLVPLLVVALEAGGLDDQGDGRAARQVESAFVTVEVTLDGEQAIEVAHVELDARP